MRRVEVIGPSCSGKTTTARRLAEILGVPYIELDALHHDAGWTEAPADIPFRTAFRRVLWRTFHRAVGRVELWNGNRESLRLAFSRESIVLWVLRTHRGFEEKWVSRLDGRNVVRVTDADAWLQSIQATESMSGSSNGSERQKTPPFAET